MHPPYRSVARHGAIELEVKKSRFICSITRATSEEDARSFIAALKTQRWNANHNCSAYVIGDRGETQRTSDDGEPSGTAGVPMLTVLQKRGLTDTVVVVTRYFGGTKLGAGGLIRAYSQAVSDAINEVGIVERKELAEVTVTASFEDAGRLENSLRAAGREPVDVRYGEEVALVLTVGLEEVPEIEALVAGQTSGRAVAQLSQIVHTLVRYCSIDA